MQQSNFAPDVYWIKFPGLHAIADVYGENSTTIKEAKTLLKEAIHALAASFGKVYEDSLLIGVITNDAIHTRRTRAVNQGDGQGGKVRTFLKLFITFKLYFYFSCSLTV